MRNLARLLSAGLPTLAGCIQLGGGQSPLLVNVKGNADECRVTVARDIAQASNFTRVSQPQLVDIARHAKSRRAIVVSDLHAPYKCIGATIITLQQAGLKVDLAAWDGR